MTEQVDPLSNQLTIIIGLTVVGFMAFGLALSFYRNVLFDQLLSNLHSQNMALQQEIQDGYRQLEYYKSAQYKDKYAKENLGKINPSESVLVITNIITDDVLYAAKDTVAEEKQEAAYMELLQQMPVYQHWQLYLFKREHLRQLRQSYFGTNEDI